MQQQYLSTRHQLQHQSQTQSQISNRKRTRNLGCMKIEKIVGSGTFGLVFKAIDLENNVEVALKKIKTERETQGFPITALREIKILTTLKHENIVNLREILMYDKTKDSNSYSNNGSNNNNGSSNSNDSSLIIPEGSIQDNDIFMVFEFVDYDLSGILKSNEIILTDEQVKSYTKQLLVGVHYLHSHNILHRDLKCANILITRNNVLKIADWGLARVIPAQNICLTTPVVTLWYRSPELILGNKKYGYEVDVWSVGCIFAEMKTKQPILDGRDEANQFDLIHQLFGSPSPEVLKIYQQCPDWRKLELKKEYVPKFASKFQRLGKDAFALLSKLLDLNPKTRISAANGLLEPYVADAPPAAALSRITAEPTTEWKEQEKQKKEREDFKKREEEKRLEQERQNYIRQERPKSSARQRAFARSGASTMIAIKPSEAAALGLNVHAIVEKSADDKSNDASVATEKPAVTTCIEISQNGKLPAEESVTTTDDRVVKAVKQDHHNSQIKADNVVSIASISSSNNLKASTTNQNSIKDSKQEELWGSLK